MAAQSPNGHQRVTSLNRIGSSKQLVSRSRGISAARRGRNRGVSRSSSCMVEGCQKKILARGYCESHASQFGASGISASIQAMPLPSCFPGWLCRATGFSAMPKHAPAISGLDWSVCYLQSNQDSVLQSFELVEVVGNIPLLGATVMEQVPAPAQRHTFGVATDTSLVCFAADSDLDRRNWISALNKAIRLINRNQVKRQLSSNLQQHLLHAVSVPLRHAGALLTKTISAKSGIKTTEENGDSIPILEVSDWKYLFLRIAVDTGQVHAYEYRIEDELVMADWMVSYGPILSPDSSPLSHKRTHTVFISPTADPTRDSIVWFATPSSEKRDKCMEELVELGMTQGTDDAMIETLNTAVLPPPPPTTPDYEQSNSQSTFVLPNILNEEIDTHSSLHFEGANLDQQETLETKSCEEANIDTFAVIQENTTISESSNPATTDEGSNKLLGHHIVASIDGFFHESVDKWQEEYRKEQHSLDNIVEDCKECSKSEDNETSIQRNPIETQTKNDSEDESDTESDSLSSRMAAFIASSGITDTFSEGEHSSRVAIEQNLDTFEHSSFESNPIDQNSSIDTTKPSDEIQSDPFQEENVNPCDNADQLQSETALFENQNQQVDEPSKLEETGTFEEKVNKPVEQIESKQVSMTMVVLVCGGCGDIVPSSNCLRALDQFWHPEHFQCLACQKIITSDESFMSIKDEDGKIKGPYCKDDYTRLFCDVCAGCGELIADGSFINALNKKWHPNHFACSDCGCTFDNGQPVYSKNDKPYCEVHYLENFGDRCAACGGFIRDSILSALGKKWHSEHFVCVSCEAPFPNGAFFVRDDNPYCASCIATL